MTTTNTTVITRIEEITLEINAKLDVIQQESVNVGLLLIEAKEEMTEKGGKYVEFLAYCSNEFNIGKSQVSKLMRVATVFADDKRFNGVAMRVLYALATDATPEQMDKAAEFAENGSLNSAVVKQLLFPVAVVTQAPEAPAVSPEVEAEQQADIQAALDNVKTLEVKPEEFNIEGTEVSQRETMDTAEKDGYLTEITELRKLLAAQLEIVKELQTAKVTHNNAQVLPMLPQFKNACPYAVLGLGYGDVKITHVKKAFRELIKCGYGKGHEAFEVLTTAKDALLETFAVTK